MKLAIDMMYAEIKKLVSHELSLNQHLRIVLIFIMDNLLRCQWCNRPMFIENDTCPICVVNCNSHHIITYVPGGLKCHVLFCCDTIHPEAQLRALGNIITEIRYSTTIQPQAVPDGNIHNVDELNAEPTRPKLNLEKWRQVKKGENSKNQDSGNTN